MKIAALIQAHHKPDSLGILLDRLSGELWKTYVHIDAKSKIDDFSHHFSAANFMFGGRTKVYWGGYSQVKASLNLLKFSFQEKDITHFMLASGQCYPIKDDDEIRRVLEIHGDRCIFLDSVEMPISKPLFRFERWHYNDVSNDRIRLMLHKVLWRLPRRDPDKILHDMPLRGGDNWWLFDRSTVAEMLEFLVMNPWFEKAFRFTHCPDEMFFQTLIAGLGLSASAGCPTATFWRGGKHPEVVDADILYQISVSVTLEGVAKRCAA